MARAKLRAKARARRVAPRRTSPSGIGTTPSLDARRVLSATLGTCALSASAITPLRTARNTRITMTTTTTTRIRSGRQADSAKLQYPHGLRSGYNLSAIPVCRQTQGLGHDTVHSLGCTGLSSQANVCRYPAKAKRRPCTVQAPQALP